MAFDISRQIAHLQKAKGKGTTKATRVNKRVTTTRGSLAREEQKETQKVVTKAKGKASKETATRAESLGIDRQSVRKMLGQWDIQRVELMSVWLKLEGFGICVKLRK